MKNLKNLSVSLVIILFSLSPALAQEPDVIYVPTSELTVLAMLDMADVDSSDIVYDLGSGDGRIVITAAKEYGAKGVGIDIDPKRIKEANANAEAANVTDKVEFIQGDLFESDFRDASVVTLYLLSRLNERLKPILLEQLKPGTKIVSHAFRMGDWEPEKTKKVDGNTIYLWTVPEKK